MHAFLLNRNSLCNICDIFQQINTLKYIKIMTQKIKYILLAFTFTAMCLNSQTSTNSQKVLPGEIKLLAKAIHPFFRTNAFPSNLEVDANPVTFFWPSDRIDYLTPLKKYDFQICQKSTFTQIEEESLLQNPSFYVSKKHLSVGNWFWRYREEGKNWQGPYTFIISTKTRNDNRPQSSQFVAAINDEHPRVVVRKERLPIAQKVFASNGVKEAIIEEAGKYFDVELPENEWGGKFYKNGKRVFKGGKFPEDHIKSMITSPTWNAAIVCLCRAYLITGEEKYAVEALRWGNRVSTFPLVPTPLSYEGNPYPDGFDFAFYTNSMAHIYDCLYSYMSNIQRDVIRRNISDRLKIYYNYYCNRLENRCLDNHSWQISLGTFVRAAITVKGDVPEADKYLAYAYDIWTARDPEQSHTDGGWFGGAYVGVNVDVWAEIPVYFSTYTGHNFYDVPYYHNHPYYFLYRQFPGSKEDGFAGDGYGADNIDYGEKLKIWFDILGVELNNPVATWLADGASQKKSQKYIDFAWFRQAEGLAGGKTKKGSLPDSLPQSHLFQDIGIVNMHTDLQHPENDLHVALRSCPFGTFGHNLASHNAFNILYKGDYLFVPYGQRFGGSKNSVACYRHTRGHNSILIDGKGQPFSPEAYGWIPRFLDGQKISYACGDASNAYRADSFDREDDFFKAAALNRDDHISRGVLNRFRRHILLLKPSLVLVYDEMEAKQPVQWDWVLHCRKNMIATKNTLTVEGVESKVDVIGSTEMAAVVKDKPMFMPINVDGRGGEQAGEPYPVLGQHAYVSTIQKTPNLRILSFIQVGKVNEIKKISENEYRCGNWVIKAVMNTGLMANLSVSNVDGSSTFVLKTEDTGESVLKEIINGKTKVLRTVDELPYDAKGLEQISGIK